MNDLPWKLGKKPRWQAQEERTAKKPGARKQLNSGRVWSSLRDVKRRVGPFFLLYDNKETTSGNYTLSEAEWVKMTRDANRTPPGCNPALQIDFTRTRLIVMDESTFDAIAERLIELDDAN